MGGWLIDQVWEFRLARKEHTVEVVFEDNPGGLPALTHTWSIPHEEGGACASQRQAQLVLLSREVDGLELGVGLLEC